MADQLVFDWPTGVALGPDDFFISAANEKAASLMASPDDWPERKLVITGPAGCGKSHLARVFQDQTGASLINARDVTCAYLPPCDVVVIEDMEHLPRAVEEHVFHLHNNLRAGGGTLMMTAQTPPSRWPIALPDLRSRMEAATVVQIEDPDDALLSALIMKLFADRQIMPKPELVSYLATRIERSFAAACDIVARLDAAALAEGRSINRGLAARLLDKPA
jgi:chromosomal replication initiation ATPase DnaA